MIATCAVPATLLEHAAFAPYRPVWDVVSRCGLSAARSELSVYSGVTAQSCTELIPRFVAPPVRAVSAIEFERRVVEDNELIVRGDSLHDLMNALVWLTFPRTKRAISEAHVALGVTADGKTRPRRRDVLTLFDEAGIMLLGQREDLQRLHEAHEWSRLFVTHRQDFVRDVRPILFGHGTLEQLGSNPHRGLTAKALWTPLTPATSVAAIDMWMAPRIESCALLADDERRLSLPILGIPEWFRENETPACYNDVKIFRPPRFMP